MKDWIQAYLNHAGVKDAKNKGIFSGEDSYISRNCMMDISRVMGISRLRYLDEKYRVACVELSWEDFRLRNAENSITGKWWIKEELIKRLIQILRAFEYDPDELKVLFYPGERMAPVVVYVDGADSDYCFLMAPRVPANVPRQIVDGYNLEKDVL